jgi:hypothetical protein
MAEYKISVLCDTTIDLVVEANSLDEAKEIARTEVSERLSILDNGNNSEFGFQYLSPYPTED